MRSGATARENTESWALGAGRAGGHQYGPTVGAQEANGLWLLSHRSGDRGGRIVVMGLRKARHAGHGGEENRLVPVRVKAECWTGLLPQQRSCPPPPADLGTRGGDIGPGPLDMGKWRNLSGSWNGSRLTARRSGGQARADHSVPWWRPWSSLAPAWAAACRSPSSPRARIRHGNSYFDPISSSLLNRNTFSVGHVTGQSSDALPANRANSRPTHTLAH